MELIFQVRKPTTNKINIGKIYKHVEKVFCKKIKQGMWIKNSREGVF